MGAIFHPVFVLNIQIPEQVVKRVVGFRKGFFIITTIKIIILAIQ